MTITKIILVGLLLGMLAMTRPIYVSELPVGYKQVAEGRYIAYLSNGDYVIVSDNLVVVKRRIGTVFLGCLEVLD